MELRQVEQERVNRHVFSLYINKKVLERRIEVIKKILKPVGMFILSCVVGCGIGFLIHLIY